LGESSGSQRQVLYLIGKVHCVVLNYIKMEMYIVPTPPADGWRKQKERSKKDDKRKRSRRT
jgi:hypothetical protein